MHGTAICNFQQSLSNSWLDIAVDRELAAKFVDLSVGRLAVDAIFRVDLAVIDGDRERIIIELLPIGIHSERHGRAGGEGRG